MREIDLAWLAGIVDGEGTMGIYKQSPSPRGRGKTPSIIVGFRISNSDSRIILQSAKICERITGKQVTVNRYQSINRFPEYKISVNSQKDIFAILSAIKPYLIGKADQAEIIISVLCL